MSELSLEDVLGEYEGYRLRRTLNSKGIAIDEKKIKIAIEIQREFYIQPFLQKLKQKELGLNQVEKQKAMRK